MAVGKNKKLGKKGKVGKKKRYVAVAAGIGRCCSLSCCD
jgi:hypothetical protein